MFVGAVDDDTWQSVTVQQTYFNSDTIGKKTFFSLYTPLATVKFLRLAKGPGQWIAY